MLQELFSSCYLRRHFFPAIPVPEKEYMLIHSLLIIPHVNGKVAVCKIRRKWSWWLVFFFSAVLVHTETGKQHPNLALTSLYLVLLLNCDCFLQMLWLFHLFSVHSVWLGEKIWLQQIKCKFSTFESIGGQNFMLISTYLTFCSLAHWSTWSRSTDFH